MKLKILAHLVWFILAILASILYGLFSFRFSGYPALIPFIIICWFIFKLVTYNRFWITRAVPCKLTKGFALVIFFYYIGMFIFMLICDGISFSRYRFYSENIRFPMSNIEWVCSRAENEVYCLSRTHSRLQVFDTTGKFLRGWFVRIPRGSHWISMCDNGDIVLGKKDEKPTVGYDQFGKCIKVTEYHENVLPKESATESFDQNGNIYKLKSDLFWPNIVKINAKGVEQTIVKDPIGIWQHNLSLFFALWFFSFFIGAFAWYKPRFVTAQKNDICENGENGRDVKSNI